MAIKYYSGIDLGGDLIPSSDSTHDIGSNSVRFANIYADTLYGDGSNLTNIEVDSVASALALTVTVKNKSGGSLSKGTVVHAAPSANPPSGNLIEVIAADYDTASSMPGLGVLNETLADEAEGEAIMFGAVSGIDTSSFIVGAELYVGNNGGLTITKPTGTDQLIQKIGVVIKSHASNGLIKVFGAGRTNDVPNLLTRDITIDGADFYFGNADQIRMGDSVGLRIQHSSGHSYIDGEIGNMYFRAEANDSDMVFQADDGSGGNTTYFQIDGGAEKNIFLKNVNLYDSVRLDVGTGSDLRIYHNGDRSYIQNINSHLEIVQAADNADIIFRNDDGSGGTTVYFRIDGGAEKNIFYKNVNLTDDVRLDIGTGNDLRLLHNATASYIDNYTGNLSIRNVADDSDVIISSDNGSGGTTQYFRADGGNGSVVLYHYGNKKFETTSTGATVTGTLIATSLVKSGGTSSQFLKADGSVDSNTYLTSLPSHNHDDRYYTETESDSKFAPVKRATVTISKDSYTRVARVQGDNLASTIRMTVHGTTGNIVVNCLSDISVNHSGDIIVHSQAGNYSSLDIKIISDNNEDFDIYLQYTGSASAGTSFGARIEIFPLNNETITYSPTATAYSGTTFIHTATPGQIKWGQSGQTPNIYLGSNKVYHAGNDGSGSGLDADTLDGQHASAFASASHNHDDRYYTEDEINRSLARLAGWVPTYSNSDESTVVWSKTHEAVTLKDGASDTSVGMAYKAIRMKAGDKVRIQIVFRGSEADTNGIYFRLYFHNGDLPDGKTHVSNSASYAFVQEDDSGDQGWWENNAITTSWQNFERTYTAPADGYMSLVVLNWDGYTGEVYVKQPDIQFEKVNDADKVDGYHASSFLLSGSTGTNVGEARFAHTTYTDPNPGVTRDAKFGDDGIAAAESYVSGISSAGGSFRAPIFYDSNNTNRYVDPSTSGRSIHVNGYITASIGDGKGFEIGDGGCHLTAAGLGQAVFQGNNQLRFGPSNWDYNQWGGIKYTGGSSPVLYIGGPASSVFNSNSSPPNTEINFTGTTLVYADSSFRAPIFYDSDNTGYYINPAGVSNINELHGSGKEIFDATDDSYLRINQSNSFSSGIWFGDSNRLSGNTYIAAGGNGGTTSSRVYILGGTYTGTNVIKIDGSSGIVQTTTDSMRAPRFYDYNNTTYYTDPAGTSVFNTITVVSGTINMNNNDGFVYDDTANVMKVKYDGTTYNIWTQANDGSGSGLDADTVDGFQGDYLNHRNYTDTDNYLGGYYVSGGTEKPNSSVFGAGKLKIAMLRGGTNNLGFGGTWNDVLWMSTYTGSDVKRSTALVSSKYDNTSLWIAKQNYDATNWGTGYLIWNSGNDGSGSGLDADLLDGLQSSSFLRSDAADTFSGVLSWGGAGGATGIDMNNGDIAGLNWLRWDDDGEGLIYPGGQSFYWSGSLWQFTGGYVVAQGSMRSPVFYDSDNTAFYGNFGASDYSVVVNGGIKFGSTNAESRSGFIGRHGSGGSLNTDAYPSPLYSIGDNYRPSGTGLSNHYGVGYAHTNASFYGLSGQSGWGFYVSADGDARVQLNGSNGTISCTGDVVAYASDGRLKENVKPIENALDKVKAIRGVSYDWVENIKDEYEFHPTKMHEVGVIAQEIQAVLPEVVSIAPFDMLYSQKTGWKKIQKKMEADLGREVTKAEAKTEYEKLSIEEQESLQDKNDFLTVNYERIVPLLIEAIKEQQEQIDELKKLINP